MSVAVERPGRSGLAQLLSCLATLACEGGALDVDRLVAGRRARPLDIDDLPTAGATTCCPVHLVPSQR